MDTDWRKLGLFLVGIGGLYVVLVGVAADFAQVLSLKHGIRLLILLFIAALGYKGWEQGHRLWRNYRALRDRLDEVRDFLRRYGDNVLLCVLTRWLFEQHVDSVRISNVAKLQTEKIVVLDVSQVPLKPNDHLEGMHFAIVGRDRGERAKGTVKLCNSDKAHLELYKQTGVPCVGDLAIPIEPPDATDLERLLGNVLFIVSE